MRVPRHFLVLAVVCLLNCLLPNLALSTSATAQSSELDQLTAARVLGPQWKQISRRAGMIFAGTVLGAAPDSPPQQALIQITATNQAATSPTPVLQLRFRIDDPIAGVERGQILTIHEWVGAASMHRSMNPGQHILIFLYPPSRLGLTSPVGGSWGQVSLDPTGKNVAAQKNDAPNAPNDLRSPVSERSQAATDAAAVSVVQLERAIRSAREE
jgi:hypothetical protein